MGARSRVAAPDACATARGAVVLAVPARLELGCRDGLRDCSTDLAIEVRNCTAAAIELDHIEVSAAEAPPGVGIRIDPAERRIVPRASWSRQLERFREERLEVTAFVRTDDGTRAIRQRLRIAHPARDAAIAACGACNGRWGRGGLAAVEGCDCMTTDAGASCYSDDDCQGSCLPDAAEPIEATHRLARRAPSCAPPDRLHAVRGRCSASVAGFGCRARLTTPIVECRGPRSFPSRIPVACVD